MTAAAAAPNYRAINASQRQAVLNGSVDMTQQIFAQTVYPPQNPNVNIIPRNVGLVKRFIVEVNATVNNSGTVPVSLTEFGLSNLLSNVNFSDLNSNVRINTTGLHLTLLAGAKRRRPYAGCYTLNGATGSSVSSMLNVTPAAWGVFQAPATIAAGSTANVRGVFEVPLAYTNDDLRGAVFANVINANMNLGLTFNQSPIVATPTDASAAIYSGAAGAAGSLTQATVTVYQEYLDQLPRTQNGQVVLPVLDLSTVYELKNTTLSAITQNADFPIPFSNFRDFLSVFAIFNNNGQASGRTYGTDVNYWSLQSANFTNLWKFDSLLAAQKSREHLKSDLPAGVYYFPSRSKPISTTQYGNMELILNASTAAAQAQVGVLWESFALTNTLAGAGSLASA